MKSVASGNETNAVFVAGVIQGVALVTFPAAGTIFTSPDAYNLSSSQYGAMFVPQALMAITASLLGARVTRQVGVKRIYLLGLTANLVSMVLLVMSQFVMTNQTAAYGILLLATTSLGIGFGLTVPALNTFTAAFFPKAVDRAVLTLNALLGLGTALAPIVVAIFTTFLVWWGLPVLVTILLAGLLVFSMRLPLQTGTISETAGANAKFVLPGRFWLFAAFALLYGIVETVNGNWATLYMTSDLGADAALASLALTFFWVMVTVGRVFFAAVEKKFPSQRTYRVLPFVVAVAFVLLALLPTDVPYLGILVFGLAGFGCSALLPLTISFGQKNLSAMAAAAAGFLIAFYQIGYGIAAFGVGAAVDNAGLALSRVFGLPAVVAIALGVLSFAVLSKSE